MNFIFHPLNFLKRLKNLFYYLENKNRDKKKKFQKFKDEKKNLIED